MLNYKEMPNEKYSEAAHLRNRMSSRRLLLSLHEHHPGIVVELEPEQEPTAKPQSPAVIAEQPVPRTSALEKLHCNEIMDRWSRINYAKRRELLSRLAVSTDPSLPSMQDLIREVCAHFNVTKLALLSSRRDMKVTLPRMTACFIAKTYTKLTYPAIGRQLGNRDHTTIISAFRRVTKLVEQGHPIVHDIDAIKTRLFLQIETRERLEDEINSDAFGPQPHPSFGAGPQDRTPESVD